MNLVGRSLRRRLLTGILGAVPVLWLAAAYFTHLESQRQVDRLLDAQLAQAAQTLLNVSALQMDVADKMVPSGDRYLRRVVFQVWNAGGALVMRSIDAPETALAQARGFGVAQRNGIAWRTYSQSDSKSHLVVHVAEELSARDDLRGGILVRMAFPLLAALPLLGLLIWFIVERSLQPIRSLSHELRRREAMDLAVLETRGVPTEVLPLIEEVNRLFGRVRTLLETERRFTADAAHELRTPLASLGMNTEVALRAQTAELREGALVQVAGATDRMTHLVDQLLIMARLDAESARHDAESVDIASIVDRACAELTEMARGKDHTIIGTRYLPTRLECPPHVLHVMVRNLLDNAVRYTPQGGRIEIAYGCIGNRMRIEVRDNGPGVPEELRGELFNRFFRVAGTNSGGCGLGLSIVRRSVELCGGSITFSGGIGGRGLGVGVVFPGRCEPLPAASVSTVVAGKLPLET
jgi:two-component system sensor histidine kinase QseC